VKEYHMKAPSELLEGCIGSIPRGYALDMGGGTGEAALWLAKRGFEVDFIERDPEVYRTWKETLVEKNIILHPVDVREFGFEESKYALVYASAILHFLKPTDLWSLVDRMVSSIISGGYLLAEVFTTDDPGYEELIETGALQVEPNTFALSSSGDVIHYFAPGELSRTFSSLKILAYEENRRIDPEIPGEYRAGASLLARKI
jgi:SAM-dependent methyltransferase